MDCVQVTNSLSAVREIIRTSEVVMQEARREAEVARTRAEAAEERAETESRLANTALSQLAGVESAVAARDFHISDLTAALEVAESQASMARGEARAAGEKMSEAEEVARKAKEGAEKAEEEKNLALEAERAAVAALAAERGALEAKVEAAIEARTARAIEEFRASEKFMEELTEASTGAFLQGFQRGKEKVARELNFPQALEIEPDHLSDLSSSDNEDAPAGP